MRRYTRINANNALCIMPRKAIAWLMLVMAILTIFSFISIEVKRIVWLKSLVLQKELEIKYYRNAYRQTLGNSTTARFDPSTVEYSTNMTSAVKKSLLLLEPRDWNPAVLVDDILSDNPLCNRKLFLMVLVTSAPENFEQRDAIRKTWADSGDTAGMKSKTVFLIGRSSNHFLNVLIKNENDVSNDVLVGDYKDTYRNLTTKVVRGLLWAASSRCRPHYVLKTDDDCFVNLPLLLHFLSRQNPIQNNLYAGHVRWSSPVVRDPNSRWYVSDADFAGSRFVPYVNGAGYVLSLDVVRKFAKFSSLVRPFPNEDAYVGTVLYMVGVRPVYSARFVAHSEAWQTCNFLYLFVIHHATPTRQFQFKEMAARAWEECSKEDMANDWV